MPKSLPREPLLDTKSRRGTGGFSCGSAGTREATAKIGGAVLTVTHVTAFRRSLEQAISERESAKAILNTVIDPLVVVDAAKQKPVPMTGGGTVLFMDDEEAIRRFIGELLHEAGYAVECVSNGTEAVEHYCRSLATGQPFDVVILDLTVPGGMGGKETVEKLLKLDPEVNAIVSSGYSNDPVMAEFQKHGFRGRISKPYQIEALSHVLHGLKKYSGHSD